MLQMHPHTGLVGDGTWSFQEYGGSVLMLGDERAKCLINITGANGVSLVGLSLNGERLGKDICGVLLDKPDYGKQEDAFRIENCRIGHFSGDGVRLNRGWCFSIRHSMICWNEGDGIYLRGWDAFILDNWFTCNRKAGFGAYEENSAVTFTANRVEWNYSAGILIRGGANYNITGNYFDRCGGPGIMCLPRDNIPTRCVTITGNVFHRNGDRTGKNLPLEEDCHILLREAEGVTVTGNTMRVGRNDRDTGEWSPRAGFVLHKLKLCVIKDNVLRYGATEKLILDLGEHGEDVIIRDNVGCCGTGPVR